MLPNLDSAVDGRLVLAGLESLHAGLDDVDGGVAEDGSSSCDGTERPGHEFVHWLVGIAAAPPVLQRFHDEEADGLVRALFGHCRGKAFVRATDSWEGRETGLVGKQMASSELSSVLVRMCHLNE